MQGVAQSLYGGMLSHVPEQDAFTPEEVREVFDEIIRDEFGGAAEGWAVSVEAAKSINVKAAEKKLVIPQDRSEISHSTLRNLVVHELGVHVLRAVNGSETNLRPLGLGLNKYYDSEEGLGVIMEQAISGDFKERGVDHYITAGLAHYANKDFRGVYEVKWRLGALERVDNSGELSEDQIEIARDVAYGGAMRIFRGTDELPWFKDLAYYNGASSMWRYLEEICGDDLKFMFVLMGKANPADDTHMNTLLETSTP